MPPPAPPACLSACLPFIDDTARLLVTIITSCVYPETTEYCALGSVSLKTVSLYREPSLQCLPVGRSQLWSQRQGRWPGASAGPSLVSLDNNPPLSGSHLKPPLACLRMQTFPHFCFACPGEILFARVATEMRLLGRIQDRKMPLQQLLASPAWGSLLVSDPPYRWADSTLHLPQHAFCAKCTQCQRGKWPGMPSPPSAHTAQRVISYMCQHYC